MHQWADRGASQKLQRVVSPITNCFDFVALLEHYKTAREGFQAVHVVTLQMPSHCARESNVHTFETRPIDRIIVIEFPLIYNNIDSYLLISILK